MPESTTSQSPQEVFSSSGDVHWCQENSSNIVQNEPNLGWNGIPNQNIAPVAANTANSGFISHGIGNIPVEYCPTPNYFNIHNNQVYQRHANFQNSYPVVSVPNSPNMQSVPILVRTPQRAPPHSNAWATPQNIKLIQTAWNKTSSGGVKKQKRVRTAFTSQQMMELELEYARTRYLDRSRRIELADMLRLNERTIKIWFQNRRMKEKKDRAENLEGVEDVSTTQSPPELGVPMFHDTYQATNEAFNRMGVVIEQYPVSSTSTHMNSMPQTQMAPGSYQSYTEACPAQYQEIQLQVQHYPSPYSEVREVQELSPESTPQSEGSISADNSTPSDIVQKSWDLSWIRSIQAEEEC